MKRLLVFVAMVSTCVYTTYSQCDSLSQVQMVADTFFAMNQDSTIDPEHFVLSNEIVPFYNFDYQQDSCRIQYRVGEFSKNSVWLHLQWCNEKVYNFDEVGDSARWDYTNAQLSGISRTRTFSVARGDTIGVFREMFWFDNATSSYNPARLKSDDVVSFSIELVDAAANSRMMLLDTLSIRSNGSTTNPCLYAWRPVVARIGHIVPSSVDTTNAFVRVNVAASGSSGSRFMRYDNMTLVKSPTHLTDLGWKEYASNVASSNTCSQSCTFDANGYSNPRRVQVTVSGGQTAVDRIDVIDLDGNVVNTESLPTSFPYSATVTTAGVYVVAGYKNSSLVCTQLTIVP